MVDMAYTLGGTSFRQFTTFAGLINRQHWKMAGDDLTCSKWCNAPKQDNKRCHRDAAVVAQGCSCSGTYPQTCDPTHSSCCGSQETCCKGVFTYKSYITKTFDEVACCPFPKATCCTHNRCCRNGGICCPPAPAEPTFCCPTNYPHCAAGRMCARDRSRDSPMMKGTKTYETK
ncbi:hypothetical protein AC249_AIPGENE27141 [Exaiptasia diaphana]|nr:hypothetical protein AC249_AIPGENE27141 [Exaiptasia diaphana]